MNLQWHKTTHWEYWSAKVVYLPTFFYWVFNAIKLRKFFFFKYANPGMKNGGLYGDSKYEMYKHLPDSSYPKTVLLSKGQAVNLTNILAEQEFKFPLILKPDTGFRGIGVKMVHSYEEAMTHLSHAKQDLLLQSLVSYPNELGLFYCRFPGASKGSITGITLKRFLTVRGDGQSTIEQLLSVKPRFAMQIEKLGKKLDLQQVLPLDEERCLVPFGNHNLGTEFLDGSDLITDELTQTFDDILKKIPGFFYGRLDIRYADIASLAKGKHFSIIEINGAKSEPTHIYDPRYSFFQGQREIHRHQNIFVKIAAINLQQARTLATS